jgi:hypothetical protein
MCFLVGAVCFVSDMTHGDSPPGALSQCAATFGNEAPSKEHALPQSRPEIDINRLIRRKMRERSPLDIRYKSLLSLLLIGFLLGFAM